MKTMPASYLVTLGATISSLASTRKGSVFGRAEGALFQLQAIHIHLKASGLAATERLAFKTLRGLEQELKAAPPDAVLSDRQLNTMHDLVLSLWPTLESEASEMPIYLLSDVRLSAKNLMVDVPSFFAKGAFSKLPTIAQYDFQEAGKCLAFSRHTAAAFHTLRGTEAVLRIIYSQETQKDAGKKTWGTLVEDLKRVPTVQPALLNDLDSIRQHFRNPTQHPEHRYDEDGAFDLFQRCLVVVNTMSRMLP